MCDASSREPTEKLKALGILPGVKPHLKVYQLPGQPAGATVMQGLDSLARSLCFLSLLRAALTEAGRSFVRRRG